MINESNYKDYLLGYIDNQVDASTRRDIEAYVRLRPEAKEELATLRATKLIPDEKIVFKNKHLLLKEEAPVRQLSWYRTASVAAIAAMLIGFILWISFFRVSEPALKPIAKTAKPIIKEKAGNPFNQNTPQVKTDKKEVNTPQLASITIQEKKKPGLSSRDINNKKNMAANLPVRISKEEKKEEKQAVATTVPNPLNNTMQAPQIPLKVGTVQHDTLTESKKEITYTILPTPPLAMAAPVTVKQNPQKSLLGKIGRVFGAHIKFRSKDDDGNTFYALEIKMNKVKFSSSIK